MTDEEQEQERLLAVAEALGIDPDDEISITWEIDPEVARVIASLGGAKIIVENTDTESVDAVQVLVQALPSVMNAVYEAIPEES